MLWLSFFTLLAFLTVYVFTLVFFKLRIARDKLPLRQDQRLRSRCGRFRPCGAE
jgi:uncharacterized protein YpmS